jgi:RNA polymerase sigma factor (sigma-70 family)
MHDPQCDRADEDRRLSPQDVARALDGDRRAMQALVSRLLPVVQSEVGFVLLRGARVESRDPRQEVRDFVQEVFVALLAKDGRTLRAWDPERGRSLDSYVRLIARRQVAAILRSGKKSPWADKPVAGDELERELPETHGDASTAKLESVEELDRVLDGLRSRLDERGMLLFEMLYVEERSVEEVMAATEMTRDAVYAWRSRFRKLVAKLGTDRGDEKKPA